MFNIQYGAVDGTHKMQEIDSSNKGKLLVALTKFERPIVAVYEQSTPITKTMQAKLRTWNGTVTREAHEFMNRL